ncbi:MAG: Mrp/NBP35 family ATP-binding protein [Candidatus Marinimicrobia bacterium]|jgi:ATP-binding protein involved in chromosome partitioning|nr:Mrp/NBP35 family ATP-binding protein [Candidatus Neomarinimicrobiota bacterium]MBT3495765.1 Mrp/NBP35 family ATP-binding protein [Candidatus Neomarinimicrobiota bacterium]MBT3692246.1 Mrp/NBP35 family ATP-binding protein [Candidatus Neomarinimicrobiota bacterium]MBT3731755.1 Mrp/NBP35 family ATP-binding protein [Candidatus Neomarinimicrobiota bacterium]MBT4143782.1 Mrp/NBP35 family ATP-binding protein [Candidatus Neomarinimicrobiota bacterium]
MNKEKVLALLKEINYPGFSRDIVSFGMIGNIEIDENTVSIQLKITSDNEEKKQELVGGVKEKLSKDFENVLVEIEAFAPQQAAHTHEEPKAQAPSPVGEIDKIIAVASGKGGVGKSTVAVNLACGLQAKGYKVGLLDLDIYGPSLPIILGFNGQPELTQERKLIPLDRYGLKVMSFGFISGNETPAIWRGPLVARMTEQFFNDVIWGELDYLILDLPPGTGDVQLTLTQKIQMTGAIIVSTPQEIALADVRKGADMFAKVNVPLLGVVENMSGLALNGTINDSEGGPISSGSVDLYGENVAINEEGQFDFVLDLFKRGGGKKESERLDVPLLGEIPMTPDIMASTDLGEPIIRKEPNSSSAKAFQSVVENLLSSLK